MVGVDPPGTGDERHAKNPGGFVVTLDVGEVCGQRSGRPGEMHQVCGPQELHLLRPKTDRKVRRNGKRLPWDWLLSHLSLSFRPSRGRM